MKRRRDDEPSLFDFDPGPEADMGAAGSREVDVAGVTGVEPDECGERVVWRGEVLGSEWREVPQAIFDRWPTRRQLAYCAARDIDAAEHTDDVAMAEWFRWRATGYKEMAHVVDN